MDPADVDIVNEDDDVAGVSVGPITGNTTETGGTASFAVRLTCMPASSVQIDVSSDDKTEGTVSLSFLEFNPGEWNVPQTVTVEGRDDDVADGDQAYRIVLGAAISDDNDFSGIDPDDVDVVNTDDDTPGITASAIDGNTTEAGGQARFTVQLNTEPTAQVQVAVQSLDSTEGSVSPSNLLFVPGNYDTPQTVVVTGVDDPTDDGDFRYDIQVGPATSEDPVYQGLGPRNVGVVNEDDDDAGFAISETDGSTEVNESGSTDRFSVVLESMPANGVVVLDVTSEDETEATVAPEALSFASANWSIPQDVTVTGIDDNLPDGRKTATITVRVNAAVSSPEYAAVPAQNIDAANDGEPDLDSVPAEIEEGAPNGGDGNCDGMPDSGQAHVASLPDAATGAYVTVELFRDCDSLENVSTHAEDEFGNDASYDYPQGLTSFELPCAAATVVIYYHGLTQQETSESYRKFQGGEQSPFFTFGGAAFGTATVAGHTVPTVTLTLADNQIGDLDDIVDRIKDPGGMARFNGVIPTVNVFGLALLALAIGWAGWMKKRRKGRIHNR